MNEQILKRFKSFLWRALSVGLVALLEWILANLGVLELPVYLTGILGLTLGEITKWLNRKK